MKILFINKFFHLNGGSETVFFQEREFLQQQGHTVIDFSMEDDRNLPSPYSEFFIPNTNYDATRGAIQKIQQAVSFIHSSVALRNLEALLVLEKPQIAHLHNIYHQLTPSIIPLLKSHGIKVVLTLHDYKLVCPAYLALQNEQICNACSGGKFSNAFTENCRNSRLRSFLLSTEALFHKWRKSYDGVDLFLAPSRFLADLTSQRIPKSKLHVLHNGIDTNAYRANYNDDGYCLYFGRLSKEKGVKTLLQAHRAMMSKYPLKIAGTGPLAEELALQYPEVEFLGYQSSQTLHNLIAHAAFVVVPSEWYENCSMVVLEAMAFGIPVIGSHIGGIPEQIEDGKTGFLFEMGNVAELAEKMQLLATNYDIRVTMGKAARAKLEQGYSLQSHCSELLDIYSELVGQEVRGSHLPPAPAGQMS